MTHRCLAPWTRCYRLYSTRTKLKGIWEYDSDPIEASKSLSTEMTSLPFAYRKESESFGQLVKGYHHDVNEDTNPKVRVISREDLWKQPADGEVMKRSHDNTELGKTFRDQIKIPERITKSIYNHMLALRLPKVLRYQVAQQYLKLKEAQLYEPTRKPHENDVYIASFFTQDYASVYQVLKELFKRQPDFTPTKVLDIGYGPATGMIALNEIMGNEWDPEVKDSFIVGHHGMQDRAKILLSRQLNEYPGALEDLFTEEELHQGLNRDEDVLFDDFIGEVKTNKIKIKTKILDRLNTSKKYNLIIAQHQLLQDRSQFPHEVDANVQLLLKMLEPDGFLVLVERGTPLGFESVARARQTMIRPEKFLSEHGKIPRPYSKASGSAFEQEFEQEFEIDDQIELDEEALKLKRELEDKYGTVDEEDLEFEEFFEVGAEENTNYHLKVIAPCSHHRPCPLQTGKPQFYDYPSGSKLSWCHFDKSVERPRFLLELKRGQVLSSKWADRTRISPTSGTKGSSGRIDGNNYEIANYSYLIVGRCATDSATVTSIEQERANQTQAFSIGSTPSDPSLWPRILKTPMKRKGHVTMSVCGSSGEIEKWTITKSFDKLSYHDARKATSGDLWGLDAKTKLPGRSNQDQQLQNKLQSYEDDLLSKMKRDVKFKTKKERKAFEVRSAHLGQREMSPEEMVDVYTTRFNMKR